MNIPQSLILFRALLIPAILGSSLIYGKTATVFILVCMYLGFISDIADGIIARKLNQSTATLRKLDSRVDLFFWLCIAIAAYILYPEAVLSAKWYIGIILLSEAACHMISFIKFKKELATHAYLSKIWGISLIGFFTALFGFGNFSIPFYTCFIIGMIAHIDCLGINLILPKWMHDIPSSYHAWQIRKGKQIHRNPLFHG